MKTISTELRAHLAGEVTTLATLWKLTRRDGVEQFFTDHNADLVYDGDTYLAATGYVRSAVRSKADLSVDSMEIESYLDSDSIDEADLRAGVYDAAIVKMSFVNWADLTQGEAVLRRGPIGRITIKDGAFAAEGLGMTAFYETQIIETYSPTCPVDLGSARCQVDMTEHTHTGVVTSVLTGSSFAATINGPPANGMCDNGVLTWTVAANPGAAEVKFQADGVVTLWLPSPNAVQVGDTFSITNGCDKTTGAGGCAKFGNIVNFQGFPYIPGVDAMFQTPNSI